MELTHNPDDLSAMGNAKFGEGKVMQHMRSRVFVVDDNKSVLLALRFLLEAEDLTVETYTSAQSFLDRYDATKSGCILLDLRIPGMNGLELQELLAAHNVRLPIIIITGQDESLMTIRALDGQIMDIQERPLKEHACLNRIHQAITGTFKGTSILGETG